MPVPSKSLGHIDAHIYRLEREFAARIAVLEAAEATLVQRLERVVYPINTLPSFLLVQIFLACLPVHGRVRRGRPDDLATRLSLVCRQWRMLVEATPGLWTSHDLVLVRQASTDYRVVPAGFAPLQHCLQRAGGASLSLTLRQSNRAPRCRIPAFLRPLIPRAYRLETDISPVQFRHLRPLGLALPNLEHLACATIAQDLADIVRCAPRLRELRLRKYPLGAKLVSSILTKLEICIAEAETSFESVIDILDNCPMLQSLRTPLQPRFQWTARQIRAPITHHDHLEELALPSTQRAEVEPCRQSIWGLLDQLSAPKLRTLEILVPGYGGDRGTLNAARIFTSSCAITSLRLTVTAKHAPHWVALFPALESLELIAHHSEPLIVFPFVDAEDILGNFHLVRLAFSAESWSRDAMVKIAWHRLLKLLRVREHDDEVESLEKIEITAICHKMDACLPDPWTPPDALFVADDDSDAAENVDARETLRLTKRIRMVQKWCAVPEDEDIDMLRIERPEAYKEEDWPESELDEDGNEWFVRRWPWPESEYEESSTINDDPLAQFTLHAENGQTFKEYEMDSSEEDGDESEDESDSEMDEDSKANSERAFQRGIARNFNEPEHGQLHLGPGLRVY
ncbi:F-box domain-containing protein [Mycena chlorophos]|uniref:F-box domain-containing protein n=1 Tax=Mycena chlorophos TaxID=658473 RepID=A0A8H6THB7_MYCCL|nr:F-box domain-containing protein [Mycena chlorophos]